MDKVGNKIFLHDNNFTQNLEEMGLFSDFLSMSSTKGWVTTLTSPVIDKENRDGGRDIRTILGKSLIDGTAKIESVPGAISTPLKGEDEIFNFIKTQVYTSFMVGTDDIQAQKRFEKNGILTLTYGGAALALVSEGFLMIEDAERKYLLMGTSKYKNVINLFDYYEQHKKELETRFKLLDIKLL